MSNTNPSGQPAPFESALQELQAIVKKMESGELQLEDSLRAFEQGVKLTRFCSAQLSAAEQKVDLLLNAQSIDSSPKTGPFTAGS